MIKLNAIPLDYAPRRKILPKLADCPQGFKYPEMSDFESAFLCGMLETYPPKKILEVGISRGATTSIILQVLEDHGEPYEMHSVDLFEKHYGDKTKDTGYMALFAKEKVFNDLRGTHEFHLGRYLPQVIDEIGGDIDFVILDTVHYTPGELLDFPVMLPYLKDGTIVVLHDVSLNQRNHHFHKGDAHATGLLLSAVTAGEKFLNLERETEKRHDRYPNIAAFTINEHTREYIENVFLALTLTWHYLPADNEVAIYREFYEKHYPAEVVDIFNETVKMNRNNIWLNKK